MSAPDRIRYLEELQEAVLALRGAGLALSPLDADRLLGWWTRGVPLGLALEAVREAAARHRASGRAAARRPFPLRLADRLVEERFGAYVRRSATVPTPGVPAEDTSSRTPPVNAAAGRGHAARLAARLEALAEVAAPPLAAGHRAAARALRAGEGEPLDRVLLGADQAAALAYLRALPRDRQRRLAREAAGAAGPRGRVPRAAHRATLRALLGEAAHDDGFPRPSDLP